MFKVLLVQLERLEMMVRRVVLVSKVLLAVQDHKVLLEALALQGLRAVREFRAPQAELVLKVRQEGQV